MKLVIVESPAKCKTIQKYLGDDYLVKASNGHVRDLAISGKDGLGVDVSNNFKPTYQISKHKIKVVNELKKAARNSEEIILATDPDREGEAIAWHLAKVLNLDPNTNKRLEFHEITRDAISLAMKNPRTIDLNLVSSQETRRILDRIIGFRLSTLLKKKIHSKSAGRVQSATLKLIYDNEQEIKQFVPEEYWNILVNILFQDKEMPVSFVSYKEKIKEIKDETTAQAIIKSLPSELIVEKVKKVVKETESKPPFTTSTMQQEAFSKLKFKTKRTQAIAQELYEGIDIAGEHMGLISYIRTDSTRLAPTFIAAANRFIEEKMGKEYIGSIKKTKSTNMQDAHEAIRPTNPYRTPDSIRSFLTPEQYSLYKLIYIRAISSLMKGKKEEVMSVTLLGGETRFKFDLTKTLFKGYETLYKTDNNNVLEFPIINNGDKFIVANKNCEQKFTIPPARFTEAKLVKKMEEVGIGRPSTYASTIELLKKRKYVIDEKGTLCITEQGSKTLEYLEKGFPDIVNVEYTASMEKQLDEVQDGNSSCKEILTVFYKPFQEEVEQAYEKMAINTNIYLEEKCPLCGSPLVEKDGKHGKFVGCSNFPKCKYIKKELAEPVESVGRNCPQCGKPLVKRNDKKGNSFVACSGFPKCRYIEKTNPPTDGEKKCPLCGSALVKKKGKYGYFLGCSNFPKCKYMEKIVKYKKK